MKKKTTAELNPDAAPDIQDNKIDQTTNFKPRQGEHTQHTYNPMTQPIIKIFLLDKNKNTKKKYKITQPNITYRIDRTTTRKYPATTTQETNSAHKIRRINKQNTRQQKNKKETQYTKNLIHQRLRKDQGDKAEEK